MNEGRRRRRRKEGETRKGNSVEGRLCSVMWKRGPQVMEMDVGAPPVMGHVNTKAQERYIIKKERDYKEYPTN